MTSQEINRQIMTLLPGDEFYINHWREPMIVAGRSRHFIVAYNPNCDEVDQGHEYTIIPIPDSVDAPVPECGPDHWIFGFVSDVSEGYDFQNAAWVAEYLLSFESGKSEISRRNSAPIVRIRKSKEWLNG